MKSSKKFLLNDLRNHYKGNVNYNEVLDNCYLDRGENDIIARWRRILYVTVSIASAVILLIIVMTIIMFIYYFSFDSKLGVSKENKEYMESLSDDFNENECYKISYNRNNYMLIYSGIDYLDDGSYNRLFFYVFDISNNDLNVQLILDDTSIEVVDDSCGILTTIKDENNTQITFQIAIEGKIKEYSLDLFK